MFSRKSDSTLSSSCCRTLTPLLPPESMDADAEEWEFWESVPRAVNAQHRVWKKGSSWVMLDTERRLSRGNLAFLGIPSACFGSWKDKKKLGFIKVKVGKDIKDHSAHP